MNRLLCFLLLWLSSLVDQSQSSSYLLQRLKSSNLAFFKRCSNQCQKTIPTSTKIIPFIGIRDENMIDLRGGSNVNSDGDDDDTKEVSVVVLGNTQTTHKSSKSHSKSLHQRSLTQTPKRTKKRRSHRNAKLVGQSHVKPSVPSSNQDNGDAAKSLGKKTPILRLSSSSSVSTGATSNYRSNTKGRGTKDHNKIQEPLPKRKKKSKGNRTQTIGGTIRTTSMVDDTSPASSSAGKGTRTLTRHKKKKKKSARSQNLLDEDDACDKELKPIHANSSDNGKKKTKKKKKKKLSTTTSKTRQKDILQHEMDDKNSFLDEGNTENNEIVVPLNTEMTKPGVNEPTLKQKMKKKTKKRKRKSSGVSTKAVDTSSRNEKEDVDRDGHDVDVSIQVQNVTETFVNITDDSVSNQLEDGDGGDIQSMVESHVAEQDRESEIDTKEQKEKSSPGLILKDAAVVLEAELALRIEENERRAMASVRNEEQITIEDSRQDEEEVGGETDAETDASIEVDAIKTVITIEDSKQDEEEDGRETDAETDASIEVDMKTVDNESNVVAIDNVLDDQLDETESQESIHPVNQESEVLLHDNLESKGVSDTKEYATYKTSVEEKDSVSSSNEVEQEVHKSKEDELHSRVSEAIFILEEVTVHENETEKRDVPQVDSSLDVEEFKTCADDEKEEPIISINMKESMILETTLDDENEDDSSLKSFEDGDADEVLDKSQTSDDDSDVETKPYSRQISDSKTELSSLVGEHEQSEKDQSVRSDESTICLSDTNNADEERASSDGDSSKTGEGCTDENQKYSDDLNVNSTVDYDSLKDATDSEELEEDAERRNDINEEDDTSDDDHSDDDKFQYESRKVVEDVSATPIDSGNDNDNDEASNDSNSQQESRSDFHDEIRASGTGLSDASDRLKIESTREETFEKTVTEVDTSEITVSVITWNLAELSPSDDEASFMKKFRTSNGKGSDLVLFGCQETENTKPRRNEGSRSREIRRILIHMLGKKYVPIAIHSLGGVQMALFCKKSLLCDLEHVSLADVACGIGNVFHNKGGIGAFVQLRARNPDESLNARDRAKSVKMLLVVCHLAAHVKKVDARNADYWRIISELEAKAPPSFLRPSTDPTLNGGEHLLNAMDHVVFAGDLNYRIDLPREEVEKMILEMESSGNDDEKVYSSQNRLKLLRHDQLLKTISQGSAFKDMVEGEITFAPTFKYDKGTKTYDSSHKLRIPAWTDRILFRPFGVRLQEYNCVPEAIHSDHRPVYATLLMKLEGRHVEQSTGNTKKKRKRTTKSKKQ